MIYDAVKKLKKEREMMKKIKWNLLSWWEGMDVETVVRKRELFLEITVCILAGIVVGLLFSPRKSITIGSNNSSIRDGNYGDKPPAEEIKGCEEEA